MKTKTQRKKQLHDWLDKAHDHAVSYENDRHLTAMTIIVQRFRALAIGVESDNLATCPECGAAMTLGAGMVFFRWLCEAGESHSGRVRW